MDFAYSYITRSGRIDDARLRAMSPAFMARYEATQREGGLHDGEIADQVPLDNAGAREIGFLIPERYNASRILFDNLAAATATGLAVTGPPARAPMPSSAPTHRAGATALQSLGLQARRPHRDVPRRHGCLSGGVLRRGARRLRAAAAQYADAVGSAAVLSVATPAPRSRSSMPNSASASMRRRARTRRCSTLIVANGPRTGMPCRAHRRRAVAASISDRARRGRHLPQRDGVLDVFVGLDRTSQGHRPSAARHGLQRSWRLAQCAEAAARRHLLLGAEDLLRLRLRQFDHVPFLCRRGSVLLPASRSRRRSSRRSARSADGVLRAADALHHADAGRAMRRRATFPLCGLPVGGRGAVRSRCSIDGRR